jgi:hypothetical protein
MWPAGERFGCRRYPPTVQYMIVPKQNLMAAGVIPQEESRNSFPTVHPDWWCGEFVPALAS